MRKTLTTFRLAAGPALVVFVVMGVGMGQDASSGEEDRERWDRRFAGSEFIYGREPARFLSDHRDLLPPSGRALDVAAGEGRNAVFLALHGFEVDAVDISRAGLEKAQLLADEAGVSIRTIVADLTDYDIKQQEYDVVVVINYLQRDLMDDLKAALKPGGIIIYQTYTTAQLDIPGAHPMRRDFLLEPGELRASFEEFTILEYRETATEHNALAGLIARKPSTL